MYYIQTADRLTRTSVWLEKMEGGIDSLGTSSSTTGSASPTSSSGRCSRLSTRYECEWKAVVNDPEKRRFFQQFANTDLAEPGVEFVTERGQQRPADWPADFVPLDQLARPRPPAPDATSRDRIDPLGAGRLGQRLSR